MLGHRVASVLNQVSHYNDDVEKSHYSDDVGKSPEACEQARLDSADRAADDGVVNRAGETNRVDDTQQFDRPGGEQIVLRDSDPEWDSIAKDWVTRITIALLPNPVTVEHIGSTSVPGLIAKPVIDLLISVADVDEEAAYRRGLESLGLVLRERSRDHRFFRPPAGTPRTVHVHVCQTDSAWEHKYLRFRDRLRKDATLAAAYAELKRRLASEVGDDRLAYSQGKDAFITAAIALG